VALGVLVLCALLGFGGFLGYREVQASTLYNNAETAFKDERWDDAIKSYDDAIKLNSGYKDAKTRRDQAVLQRNLALTYREASAALDSGDFQGALAKFDQVLQTEPSYKDAPAKRAQAERALKLASSYGAAMEAIKAEQWRPAVEKLDEVIALDPTYKDAQAQRKNAASQLRLSTSYASALQAIETAKWDQALDQLGQVLAIDPSYKDAAARKADIETKRATLTPVAFQLTNRQWNGANYDEQNIDLKNQLGERIGQARIWARYTWENVVDTNEAVFIIGLRLTESGGNTTTLFLMAHEPSGFRASEPNGRFVLVRGNGSDALRVGALNMAVNYQASINPSPRILVNGRQGDGDTPTFRSYTLNLNITRASSA
jgi:tetratricopeptide (TPR) repeat protein